MANANGAINRFCCEAFSSEHLGSVSDVERFFRQIVHNLKVNFHPDDGFETYVSLDSDKPSFSVEEVALANRLMDEAFDVCEKAGVDIYALGMEAIRSLITWG